MPEVRYNPLNKAFEDSNFNGYQNITDFGMLEQFNLFESGHSFLNVIKIPKFMGLDGVPEEKKLMIKNAIWIMEKEFKGLDGLEDLTTETYEVNDGLNTVQLINKSKEQSGGTISMRYNEKAGAILTSTFEYFIKGVADPRSGYKTWNGLVTPDDKPSPKDEVFTMLYSVLDSTGRKVSRAWLLLAAQPTKAELSIYNSVKGEYDAKEVTAEFNCFAITNDNVIAMANSLVLPNTLKLRSTDFVYTMPGTTVTPLKFTEPTPTNS